MTILRDISIYWAMFHVIFLFILLFRSRLNRRKTLLVAGSGMGILMFLNGVGLMLFGIDMLSKVFLFTCSIPSFILFYVSRKFQRLPL